jgi:outer membrane biosynthesis protein TonB
MKITSGLSALLHVAVILIAWLGIPSARPMLAPVASIEVEIVSDVIAKETPPKPAPPKPAKKPPPPPPPQVEKTPEPVPEPVIKPVKEEKAVAIPDVKAPEPAPKPKPKPIVAKKKPEPPRKPRPRPKMKPKPKPKKIVRKPPKKPKKNKPKPPPKDDFASVLKTVEKLKPRPAPPKPEKKIKKDQPFAKIAQVLKRKPTTRPRRIGAVLSSSELDRVRQQIEQCWSLPAGARGAEDMVVEIRTVVNPDGRVRMADIVDSARLSQDPFFRAMAESARRAVMNPRCQPLRLPLDKYSEWRVMVLNFDPRGMF